MFIGIVPCGSSKGLVGSSELVPVSFPFILYFLGVDSLSYIFLPFCNIFLVIKE